MVLRVFSLVQKQVGYARLWLVGDGPERPKIQAMATSLGLRNVSFLGTRHDMDRVYNRADLLLVTSDLENMPLAMLEAMSCELPVVSSDVGGIPEFVKHGNTGFLHTLRRPEMMASAVAELLKNEELRGSIGRRAREAVIKNYSSNIIVSKYEKFYRTTLRV
jgi:glycosyltransferase involved in cell wall biosynthesis